MSLANLRTRVFRRVKERAGLPQSLTFQNLRHNFGSHLLSIGVPITTISKLLGHANPGIPWTIYMHEIPDDHQMAREAIASLAVPFSGYHYTAPKGRPELRAWLVAARATGERANKDTEPPTLTASIPFTRNRTNKFMRM